MRHWSYVDNLGNGDTCIVDGTDGRLTACAWTLYIYLYLAKTCIISSLGCIFCCHLGCIRSVLLASAEAALTC